MAELNQNAASNGGRRRAGKLKAKVDLTAMVDLAFLLVTFFILTTRLDKPKQQPLAMPTDGEPGPVAETRTLTLCLGAGNQVLWYRGQAAKPLNGPLLTNYSAKGLRQTVMDIKKRIKAETGKDMIVLVKPAEHSSYGNLISALDELNITGADRYAVVDIAKEDEGLLKAKNVW